MGNFTFYLCLSFLIALTGFVISVIINDSSIADIFWGLYFVAIADFSFFKLHYSVLHLIIALMINIWGIRLAIHILRRKLHKPEDRRYAEFRLKWGKYFLVHSLIQNYLFQALLATIIALPIYNSLISNKAIHLNLFYVVGILIWLFGFIFEVIADKQLSSFLIIKDESHQILQTGLWRYSRHPNYFGEVVLWWAIFLVTFSTRFSLINLLSPILISFLILFVSGVPLAEKRLRKTVNYKDYINRTSVFIPLPTKKEKI